VDLARTQVLALVTKGITTALGIAQSVFVVWFLTRAEFGLVGLVMSIGSVVGVSQHLGIVDGTIREIAVRKDKREIARLFWVSHLTRQLVTIPLSLLLIICAGIVATRFYGRPEIVFPLQIFASVLILQGLQDVLGATLTGMKNFVALYVVQIVTAIVNVAVFAYFTWQYGMIGFFWAIVVTTAFMVLLFSAIIARNLRGYLAWPRWGDIAQYGRQVMRIGVFMYLARIAFVLWQRLPILLLGGVLTSDELGDLNISLTFGSKLTIIAMALSEVNLSWMSSLFTRQRDNFQRVVTRNMHRVLVLMLLLTLVLIFFTPEIILYVIGSQYRAAQPLILVMTVAFLFYALTDIGTSSVFVPADNPKLRAFAYGLMVMVSGFLTLWLLLFAPNLLLASLAVLLGAVAAYVVSALLAYRYYGIHFLTRQLMLFLLALGAASMWLASDPRLWWRMAVFVGLTLYIAWETHRSNLLPRFFSKNIRKEVRSDDLAIICFAGAAYDQLTWTNRQHMMSRVSKQHPVLYVEPRVWLPRYLLRHWNKPRELLSFWKKILWYEKRDAQLFIKAQWNLIPGSREIRFVANFNHVLNLFGVLLAVRNLQLARDKLCVWLYDTEAADFLPAFPDATVLYDCVDDHAAQAGVDRNPARVREEEASILKRADLVTVTSRHLLRLKQTSNKNVHLVLNAGDVALYNKADPILGSDVAFERMQGLRHPIIGTVGSLDAYKFDFALLREVAALRPHWQFVLIGAPVIDQDTHDFESLAHERNIHLLGAVARFHVPAFVREFDVCIIPYRNNPYNRASFPLKFWEFMATGKPVVVTGLPELEEYSALIGYAKNSGDVVSMIENCLGNPQTNAKQRQELAQAHGWESRVSQVLALLYAELDKSDHT
jgi:O-antigen/teichoic acid export membrane protein/glycosyltransferase involved in cell wall biosynthesis